MEVWGAKGWLAKRAKIFPFILRKKKNVANVCHCGVLVFSELSAWSHWLGSHHRNHHHCHQFRMSAVQTAANQSYSIVFDELKLKNWRPLKKHILRQVFCFFRHRAPMLVVLQSIALCPKSHQCRRQKAHQCINILAHLFYRIFGAHIHRIPLLPPQDRPEPKAWYCIF